MNTSNLTLIIILIILILMSAYFSATETAFSSFNKVRLKHIANNGDKNAALALSLSQNYDKLLSTILIGNNIVNIASASIATTIFIKYFGDSGVTISTVVMTIFILIFGEISPKSLAKEKPENFAIFSAPILRFFIIILTPINFFFICWKKLLSKMFKIKSNNGLTEEELLTMVDEVKNEGGIDEHESELIRSAIEFNDLNVSDVLTPRVDIIAINLNYSNEEISNLFFDSGYSRLPIFKDTIDTIIGVLHEKDFYNYILTNNKKLEDIIKPVVYAVSSMKISKLLRLLQKNKSHMAIISDEYGGTLGIVTLEDILEELVGEIWDEHDEVVEEFTKISEDEYKISCNANLDKMFEIFNIDCDLDISTVSGWVISELDKIPNEGDNFKYKNLDVTVTKTNSNRVIEINAKLINT
ncbi:HlyC/CorC family transporter [Clostridium ihumii]|uniref:HlyC/CorC family transporter n=1 Tax=Clostridium ihumii TaxID=1470356 RepID=UPI00058DB7AC|nr:hemolysin family protein [Clostridium ihumii]